MNRKTHYPNYNLLERKDEWDELTKKIVLKRLGPFNQPKFLTQREVILLKAIAIQFTNDERKEILDYVIDHIDQKLAANLGENERNPNSPPLNILLREGLKALDGLAKTFHQKGFAEIETLKQHSLLTALSQDLPEPPPTWPKIPAKIFFNKLLTIIISPYYSHPVIWSEIGFGGPAYPRGYYRIEHGLTDPWEAKRDA